MLPRNLLRVESIALEGPVAVSFGDEPAFDRFFTVFESKVERVPGFRFSDEYRIDEALR